MGVLRGSSKGLERNIILARHRNRKFELLNVQRLMMEPAVAQSLVEIISRCSHHSLFAWISLEHENCYFLVWEPADFTLNEVLASECYTAEAELAQIVWPVRTGLCGFLWRENDCSHSPDSQGYQDFAQRGKDPRHTDYPRYFIHWDWSEDWYTRFPSPLWM